MRYRFNIHQREFKAGIFVIPVNAVDFTGGVEYTPDGENWLPLTTMQDLTGEDDGNIYVNVSAVRLRGDTLTSGKVILIANQGA